MAQTTPKTINVPLTASQITNLTEFIEFEFIDMVRNDEYVDNIDYIVDMMNALQTLRACNPEYTSDELTSPYKENK